jgi:K+-sensing histidine kinase KdpD
VEQPGSLTDLTTSQMQGPSPSEVSRVGSEGAVARRGWLHGVPSARAAWLRYAAAIVLPGLVALAGAVSDDPDSEVGTLLSLVAVAVVAVGGGLLPALLATGLSAVALDYFFRPPTASFTLGATDLLALGLFAVTAVLISELLARQRRAHVAARRAAQRITRLQAVTQALVDARTRADVLDATLEQGIEASGAARGLVALLRGLDRELEIVASRGYDEAVLEGWHRFPLEAELPLSDAVRTKEPVYLRSVAERDERYPQLVGWR